nr:immunoglobulin heavy chain junction region [Macaca mulatta]MOX91724.1 immunoglobulin heavy chain junction region [Macaca mulatta]MOX92679.1 immunoglobulin heavy chain junction region [Macaca mulatta]MOX92738.1 immunoglobulin heavy chain junction region [Macaca mulatta]MOX93153.1 immunoglobulin heavy chain junction region [Macaca mulatta]
CVNSGIAATGPDHW